MNSPRKGDGGGLNPLPSQVLSSARAYMGLACWSPLTFGFLIKYFNIIGVIKRGSPALSQALTLLD